METKPVCIIKSNQYNKCNKHLIEINKNKNKNLYK